LILPLLLALLPAPARAASPMQVAGSVVRSKEWVIRRGATKEEEFVGDVRYNAAGSSFSSDWALFKHADRSWLAKGSVLLRRRLSDGSELEARGERAGHNEGTKRGFLEAAAGKRVVFKRTPPGQAPDHGDSARADWDGENSLTLTGTVKVWGPRLELAADEAVYDRSMGRLTLRGGRPVVHKLVGDWTTAVKADHIVATDAPRRIEAQGKAQGWLVFGDQAKLKELTK
jgi:hypothetical protein